MVYAYKNRSNYDFLNFIFLLRYFNDAIKELQRIISYREIKGKYSSYGRVKKVKITALSDAKLFKSIALKSQSANLNNWTRKKEQDRILNEE
jgi:hypothetical protein